MKITHIACLVGLLFSSAAAFATPMGACQVASLSTYEVSGFSCRQGRLRFSDFAFSADIFGDAGQITADVVTVIPLGDGFNFVAPQYFRAGDADACSECGPGGSATPPGDQFTSITYIVRGAMNDATLSWGPDVFAGSSDNTSTEEWVLGETLCPLRASCFGMGLFAGGDSLSANLDTTDFPLLTLLRIDISSGLTANYGDETRLPDGIFSEFSTPPIPEPATLPLFASGLAVLAGTIGFRIMDHDR
jgi:hypothetical protein